MDPVRIASRGYAEFIALSVAARGFLPVVFSPTANVVRGRVPFGGLQRARRAAGSVVERQHGGGNVRRI
jgi:hypothetical protein